MVEKGKPTNTETGDRIYLRLAELVNERQWAINAALCQAIGEEIDRRLATAPDSE